MGIKDLFVKVQNCSVNKEEFLNKVIGNQYLVKEMFVVVSVDKITTKALLPGMILSIEPKQNVDSSRIKLSLKDNEVVAKLITNKDDLDLESVKLIKRRKVAVIERFMEKYSKDLVWSSVVLNPDSFWNLEKISLEEYRAIRAKESKAGSWYIPKF